MFKSVLITAMIASLIPLSAQGAVVQTETIRITKPSPAQDISQTPPAETSPTPPPIGSASDLPPVYKDVTALPAAVQGTRNALIAAIRAGSVERLGDLLKGQQVPPTLSNDTVTDITSFLKSSSGDGEGLEVLAILADILDAGYLRWQPGTEHETYIWPYFAHYPLDQLTNAQKTEMYRVITAGDYDYMKDYGAWTFYRLGIAKDGTVMYFIAGE
ncbi:hypothetical protein [Pseudovibrio exalbescens]|uniref:hypothetical protein n=1 Tax=Pseudovibrio exalbescens TaxID=197461 RepID=UPI001AD93705|nr:hypothetical protein [Pseudovibrio exalbescens]